MEANTDHIVGFPQRIDRREKGSNGYWNSRNLSLMTWKSKVLCIELFCDCLYSLQSDYDACPANSTPAHSDFVNSRK